MQLIKYYTKIINKKVIIIENKYVFILGDVVVCFGSEIRCQKINMF